MDAGPGPRSFAPTRRRPCWTARKKTTASVCSFVRSDFESFFSSRQEVDFDRGEDGFDLVFSNAALHWIDFESQEKLFPKIMACLKPGGVFAFQMPDTRQQASHVSMQRAIENLGFQEDLKGKRCWVTTERDPSDYYKLLRPFCGNVDLWATEYTHVFHHSKEEEHPVVAFTSSTGLGPFVDALSSSSSEEKGIAFLEEEYDRFIREAYRPFLMIGPSSQFEEKVLFSMKKRFFCVASKKKEYY